MATEAQILDGLVAQRVETYWFDLLDKANTRIGSIYPERTVTLANDSSQGIKRRLTGFKLTPSDASSVNPLAMRVQAWARIGSTSAPRSLGIFLWADHLKHRMRHGLTAEGSLGDQGIVLSVPLIASRTITSGTLVTDAITSLLNEAGIYSIEMDASTATVGAPMTYQGGQSGITYAKVLGDLANIGGFLSPYFLSSGVCRVRTQPDLTTITPTLIYNDGGRVFADSIVESNDLLTAPNRYRAVDTAATSAEIVGDYALPSSYPHAYDNIGIYKTKRIEATGLGNNDAAAAYAQAFALQDPKAYETVSFSSPNDPRHETFDAITFRGDTYLELSWSMPLAPGGPMSHTAKRLFLV